MFADRRLANTGNIHISHTTVIPYAAPNPAQEYMPGRVPRSPCSLALHELAAPLCICRVVDLDTSFEIGGCQWRALTGSPQPIRHS